MKAMIYEKFGAPEVLQLKEVDKPVLKDDQILVKVIASTVTKYDCWMRSSTAPPGFGLIMRLAMGRKPQKPILGTEFSGVIEAVGKDISGYKIGDQVFGCPAEEMGTYAEYICLPEEEIALKPSHMTYEEAAAVPQGALTAWYFLRKAGIQPENKVLIFGASGGIGNYAVQIAKHHFKADVTGVCSPAKMDYVRSLGADQVIDYTTENFTQNGQVYDVIFDTVGKTSVPRTIKSLKENGSYLLATFGLKMILQLLWFSRKGRHNFEFGTLEVKSEDLYFLKDLAEEGKIKSIIDRCYPLEQLSEAHHYVESGQKKGNVVITIPGD